MILGADGFQSLSIPVGVSSFAAPLPLFPAGQTGWQDGQDGFILGVGGGRSNGASATVPRRRCLLGMGIREGGGKAASGMVALSALWDADAVR